MNLVFKILLIVISIILVIALALPSILNLAGLHPKFDGNSFDLKDRKALIIATNHGVLGLIKAKDKDGNLLIAGRKMTGVTDKQLEELGIKFTPQHPEEELRKAGVIFQSKTAFRDIFATLTVVDDEKRFVTGQNQNSSHETAYAMMEILNSQ